LLPQKKNNVYIIIEGMIRRNKAYDSPEKIFRGACIYDYIFFIESFFFYYENGIYYKQIKDDLFTYFTTGNISVFKLSNSNTNTNQRLKNLYESNKNRLLQGNNAFSGGGPKPKRPPGLSMITINKNSVNSNINLGLSAKTPRSYNNTNLGLSAKTPRSYNNTNLGLSASFLSLQNTPPRPPQNLFNQENLNLGNEYSKSVFNTHDFRNISTSGKQSNMMVNSDNEFYFKKFSSKQPAQTKRNLENECRVYAYLRKTSPEFIEDSTCFVNCYRNGILLRNGGSSLKEMLKSGTFRFIKQYFDIFFLILFQLHKLLVTHNDLHVGNVVGVSDIRLIDFGLANIHPQQVFDEEFLEMIRLAFSGIFFALCSKYGIM
jgi:hypothetical protein